MEYHSVSIDDLRNRTEVPEDKIVSETPSGNTFEALFEEFQANQDFRMGDIVEGRVLAITKD
jgi:exosome complex RNA-binding protein Csl4